MQERKALVTALAVVLGLAAAGVPGCAPAKAEPLEVTYYYLPG